MCPSWSIATGRECSELYASVSRLIFLSDMSKTMIDYSSLHYVIEHADTVALQAYVLSTLCTSNILKYILWWPEKLQNIPYPHNK